MTVFMDTSFLVALFNEDDEFHQGAKKTVKKLENKPTRFLTSNIALAETINVLFRLKGTKMARNFLKAFHKSKIEEIFVSKENFNNAYELLFTQKSKKGLNLFDCLHLITMKSLSINTILTFDKEFKKWVKVIV